MLIDTDIFKTEKELCEMYGKVQPSISRSIKRAAERGKPVTKIEAFGTILYDIRTLPDTITKGTEEGNAPEGGGKKGTKQKKA